MPGFVLTARNGGTAVTDPHGTAKAQAAACFLTDLKEAWVRNSG